MHDLCRRGHVCMIPRTKEFFISLKDHDEWGVAHTDWGEVCLHIVQLVMGQFVSSLTAQT